MDIDALTRSRKITRNLLDKYLKTLNDLLPVDPFDHVALRTAMAMLTTTNDKLLSLNEQISNVMLTLPEGEEGADMKEAEDCADYESKYQNAIIKARDKLSPPKDDDVNSVRSFRSAHSDVGQRAKIAGVKLPKYEIEQFSGEYEDWLGWWAQFERIHLSELDEAQKFAQLKRAIKDNTRAKAVVNKYAASVTNYPKAVKALKDRYGNKNKLIDVYIRELQTLIIETANKRFVKDKQQLTLEQLYDKLETSLNNLQSLIKIEETPFLYPMVLSCLPPNLIREWERNDKTPNIAEDEDQGVYVSRLPQLMAFLAKEVECEDSVRRASRGYKVPEQKKEEEKRGKGQQLSKNKSLPTVAALVNVNTTPAKDCIFCGKHNDSFKCKGALKMSKAEKEKKIQEAKVCYACFTAGHRSKDCPKKAEIKCTNSGCEKQGHYEVMCHQGQTYNAVPPPATTAMQRLTQQPSLQPPLFPAYAANPTISQINLTMPNVFTSAEVLHPTLRLGIKGGDGGIYVLRAAIDTMSAHSYLLKRVISGTRITPIPLLSGEKKPVFRHAVFSGGFKEVEHNKYLVELHALDWSYCITTTVFDQDKISSAIPCAPPQAVVEELQQHGIGLTDSYATEIDLLIGGDLASKLLTGNQFQLSCGVLAVQTKFGWTVMGCPDFANDGGPSFVENTLANLTYPNCLWELEAIGIADSAEKQTRDEEDAAALEHFRRTVERLDNGQYQVALPWIQGHPPLPSNRDIAEKRLISATKKLIQKGKFYDYEEIFEEWLKQGIISEVEPGDQDDEDDYLHYLSHRAVFRDDHITTQIRPVFNASCRAVFYINNVRYEHPSLNDCLVKGPNLLNHGVNVILIFREDKVAGQGDIKSAFLMVKIRPKDRKKLRFLWWKSYLQRIIRVFQHNCVVFGVNCSPFLLIVVIEHHLDLEEKAGASPTIIKKLRKSLYVDNVASSFPNVEAYEKFKEESVAMLGRAKFDLRRWESNADKEIGPEPSSVLGIKWDRQRDELYCQVLEEKDYKVVTKKSILSAIARVYDPLGMLSAVVLVPKILIQRCWQLKLQWNEPVPDDIVKDFEEWFAEMSLIEQARVSRYIGVPTTGSFLHVFCDASSSGYAAVAYLRLVEAENVSVNFVLCRARVAPLKSTTINRLELIACEIGTRLASTVIEALEWQHVPVIYWTDSTTAKAWIERNKDWGTFVHNRVKKIREKSDAEQWHHVPGSMNPADLPSRGCGMKKLINSKWLTGPTWLASEPSLWPGGELSYNEEDINAELKKTALIMVNLPMDVPWYSTWKCKLGKWKDIVNMAAWMLRFTRNCKKKKDKQELIRGPLSFEEIREAEARVFYMMQQEEQFNPKKLSLRTTEKDGLLRVETKLTYREDIEDFKYPVLIPGNHYLTELLIRQEHNRNSHAGAQFLLAHLREKVWILYGRKAIANVLKGCLCCLRFTAKAFDPVTAPLPANRIKDAAPFEITGIDFAGPIFLKGKKKSWIALFTCAVYRAVHLELVDSMNTEKFLLSLRKFIARRGRPSVIYTDNGTNFVGANNYLKDVDWTKIADEANSGPIKWIFNPPSAPWWGGWWERLVRSMKDLLVRNLGLEILDKEEMSAILCDIEATLNARPLTYVYESDTFIPLTPALFLHGPKGHGNPDLDLLDRESAVKRVYFRQRLMDNLRERFRKEYLGQLIHRRRQSKRVDLKVGDAVLIEVDNVKRSLWPMGVITELFTARDGVIRTCRIKLKKGGDMIRTVQRLYPLELTQSYIQEAPKKVQQQIKTRSGRIIRRPSP